MESPTRLIRRIVQQLDEVAGVERVLSRGAVHTGGPHYRLRGTVGPISIGEDECLVFARLIEAIGPKNCFIIGNAFGFSSVFIAKVMEMHGGESVETLDAECEGDGGRCGEVVAQLRKRMDCRILTNRFGWSPEDIDAVSESDRYDLIFIDGLHRHPQVTRDYHGVKRLADDDTIICWHDYWMPGVPQSVRAAQRDGFRCIKIDTSCEMVLGTKSEHVFHRLREVFKNAEEPRQRYRPLALLKMCGVVLAGTGKQVLATPPTWIDNWLQRHRHPASRWLHTVGIPTLGAALVLAGWQLAAGRWDLWWRPAGLLILSYLLQWLGHRIEGNDMGEVILIKKTLRRPYVVVAPREVQGGEAPVE